MLGGAREGSNLCDLSISGGIYSRLLLKYLMIGS